MNESIVQKIHQLPPLPESVVQIEAVYQDPDSTFSDMTTIVERDPLLTADILKAANSPLYGFTREIKTVTQAVGLFGMGTVRGFALASIVKKSFKLDLGAYNLTNEQFSDFSKRMSSFAVAWYIKQNPKILGILSPATFLVEIGKVLISQYVREAKLTQEFQKALLEEPSIEAAEAKLTGMTTAEVSSQLFMHWSFDEDLIDVIRNCDEPQNASTHNLQASQSLHVIRTAIGLNGQVSEEASKKALELAASYNLNTDILEDVLKRFQPQAVE